MPRPRKSLPELKKRAVATQVASSSQAGFSIAVIAVELPKRQLACDPSKPHGDTVAA